jgi:hypothetical protein
MKIDCERITMKSPGAKAATKSNSWFPSKGKTHQFRYETVASRKVRKYQKNTDLFN